VVGLTLVAACGGVDAADTPTTASSMPESAAPSLAEPSLPVTFADARGDVVTVESIERINPRHGDFAEVVFARRVGERVVATDLSATFPPEADALTAIG
jgi:iron complex transport system substrate-binding protein